MLTEQAFDKYHAIISQGYDNSSVSRDFCAFRKRLFVDKLEWELNCVHGLEVDEFDQDYTVYCILCYGKKIVGGWRAIRSDYPYLCRLKFPYLARVKPYPQRTDVWEISRFGVEPNWSGSLYSARILYSLMFRFAWSRWCSSLVAVADLYHERLLNRYGIKTRRYGDPVIINGQENRTSMQIVAGEIPIAEQREVLVLELIKFTDKLEISDETLVFGFEQISA